MEISITDKNKTVIFVQLFQHLKLFTNAISVQIDKDRFYIQGMDSSHISIFEISLMKDWFDKFEINDHQDIGINIIIFSKILSTHESGQSILLNQSNNDTLDISFHSDNKNEFNKDFTMPLIDLESELLGIPETDYDLEFNLETKKFKTIIDELCNFGDCVDIKFENDTISLSSETESEGSMKLSINTDDLEECSVNDDTSISCSFNIKFIHYMCQYHKISKYANLYFTNEIPMQCKYFIDDNELNFIRFYLAPKVED